jgi:tRNA-Thr(GGU) m(6)t(6)A37 methyltransferase TsaA
MHLEPVGTVRSPRREAVDDDWGSVVSSIILERHLSEDALSGIEDFSHLEVVFLFDRVDESRIVTDARHPRENPAWPEVGIFAQRGRVRPNRLGVSVCRLVERQGRSLVVRGLDAIDGTPVLDIKPYMAEFGPRGRLRQPAWSHELMANYFERDRLIEGASGGAAVRASYDAVAEDYDREFGAELGSKALDRWLLGAVAEVATGTIVDLGAGAGQVAAHLASARLPVVALDLAPTMAQVAARKGVASAAGDMTSLPLASRSVGAVVCLYAVIHLSRPERLAAYREMARVLRPGGCALVAFHVGDRGNEAGTTRIVERWWDRPVEIPFRFLDPGAETRDLEACGLPLVARLDRQPVPDEHSSSRSYVVAQRR